jgi:thiol-disulfide isomerase/thioredoxin
MRIALIIGIWMIALVGGVLLYSAQQRADAFREPEQPELTEGKVDFELADLSGTQRPISEWAGSYRVLNFWATWCAPCRREIPLLKAYQDEQVDGKIQVIGIAVDFAEDVVKYAEAAEFNYPILVGQEDAMAVAESSGVPFIGLPFTMILGPDGTLIDTHMGEVFEDDLDVLTETLNKLDAGEISLIEAREIL